VEKFCGPYSSDSLELKYAKQAILEGKLEDARTYVSKFKEQSSTEKILRALKSLSEEDCFHALLEIPPNILRLYPLDYSSHLWNEKVRNKLIWRPYLETKVDYIRDRGPKSSRTRLARPSDDWFSYVEFVPGVDDLSQGMNDKYRADLEKLIGKDFERSPRTVIVRPTDLSVRKTKLHTGEDAPESGRKHMSLKFELPKDAYATTFLENLTGTAVNDPDAFVTNEHCSASELTDQGLN